MPSRLPITLLTVLSLFVIARADSSTQVELKMIMQDLRSDSALIVDGLLVNDFEKIADASARIANHPRIPPEQVALVSAELGAEMAAFKELDTLVHDLSLAIYSAAQEADINSIAADYQSMLGGCLACHASYRQRISAVLNPESNRD